MSEVCVLCGAPLRPETLALLSPLLQLAIVAVILCAGALFTAALWNAIVPRVLYGWGELTFWQALAAQVLVRWIWRR